MLEVGTRRSELSALGNENLLLELSKLAREDGRILVEILLHLSEVERRRLHVDRGYRSLFAYCTGKLGWSESEAGRRIAVARAMTQFPAIGELLLSGKVHLSGVAHVAPLLTGENHASLLERISRASRREIETIAAELRPARRTRDGLRALGRLGTEGAPATASPEKNRAQAASRPSSGLQAGRTESEGEAKPKPSAVRTATASGPRAEAAESEDQGRLWPRNATGEFTPTGGSDSSTGTQLGEARYEIRFSVGDDFLKKFDRVRELLSAKEPRGAGYEALFSTVLGEFLARRDPLVSARRREARRQAPQAGATGESAAGPDCTASSSAREATRGAQHSEPSGAVPSPNLTSPEPLRRGPGKRRSPGPSTPRADTAQAPDRAEKATRGRQESASSKVPGHRPGSPSHLPEMPRAASGRSRTIPRPLRDAVYLRDGGRCTYVSPDGLPCGSSWDLELDHLVPFCRGGGHTLENLRLRCRLHNLHEARRLLGAELMDRFAARAPAEAES